MFKDISNYIRKFNIGYIPSKGEKINLIIKYMNEEYELLNIPEEYKDLYKLLLNKLNSLGEDIIKNCMTSCKCKNTNLINCWFMFQSALAARELKMEKCEKLYIKYINEQLKII